VLENRRNKGIAINSKHLLNVHSYHSLVNPIVFYYCKGGRRPLSLSSLTVSKTVEAIERDDGVREKRTHCHYSIKQVTHISFLPVNRGPLSSMSCVKGSRSSLFALLAHCSNFPTLVRAPKSSELNQPFFQTIPPSISQ